MRPRVLAMLLLTIAACAALLNTDLPVIGMRSAQASNLAAGFKYEVDLGVQAITTNDTTPSQLTIPSGTRHAEIYVVDGPVYVRWNGSTPSLATGFPWPEGHMRKEANDAQKLAGLRMLGAGEVRVIYFGDRRAQ